MPYCDRVSLLTIAGLLKRGSVPEPVLGKAITSRMDCVPQSMAIMRSNPVKGVSFQEKTTDGRVHAKCDSSMRWGATLESTNKLLKWSLFLIVQLGNMNVQLYNNNTSPHQQNIGENKILHGCIVDTNRPTPDLHTI